MESGNRRRPAPSATAQTAEITDGRRRRGAEARAAVLARAVEIASTDGLANLTIGRLAGDVGISKGNITVLFDDKEALQIATLDAAVAIFAAEVVEPALRIASPSARLKALIENWFLYVERRVLPGGCILQATSSEYRARPGAIQERVKYHRAREAALLRHTIEAAQAAGEIEKTVDPAQLAFDLTACKSAANAASLLGDAATFARARRTAQARIEAAREPRRPAKKKE